MKALRLHHYEVQPVVEEVAEPKITGPLDVIVRIGGTGLCRTDLHIIEGQWKESRWDSNQSHNSAEMPVQEANKG